MSEPDLLLDLAALVDRHAANLRSDTAKLQQATRSCEWDGAAAHRFQADALPLLHQLRLVASELADAADVLRRHAR